ncbi:MAG: hypothetical protein WD274_09770 [Acidimicrobiia bacterium]
MNGGVGALGPASHMSGPNGPEQPPSARPLTLVLFYLLIAGTVGMAVWALASIVG